MNKQEIEQLKALINNFSLKELGPNHAYISAVVTKADLDLLQKIFSLPI